MIKSGISSARPGSWPFWPRRWRSRPAPTIRARRAGKCGGTATPGSQQDFVVNVGDRVFFESDSSELTPQSRATLDKQAQWLNTYSQYVSSPSKVTPTSAARANTTSRSAPAARRPCATI